MRVFLFSSVAAMALAAAAPAFAQFDDDVNALVSECGKPNLLLDALDSCLERTRVMEETNPSPDLQSLEARLQEQADGGDQSGQEQAPLDQLAVPPDEPVQPDQSAPLEEQQQPDEETAPDEQPSPDQETPLGDQAPPDVQAPDESTPDDIASPADSGSESEPPDTGSTDSAPEPEPPPPPEPEPDNGGGQ